MTPLVLLIVAVSTWLDLASRKQVRVGQGFDVLVRERRVNNQNADDEGDQANDDDAAPNLGRHGLLAVGEKLFVSVLIIRCISHVSNLEVYRDKSFGPV